ncbi:MAG: competence/damage-inducible protein A [Acidaminobacteraceae bacterium]
MNCSIFTIGTELLMGATVNTNSAYLSSALNDIGLNVLYHVTVGDNENRIEDEFLRILSISDVVITTGGLGPTKDDISKDIVARSLGLGMTLSNDIVEDIEKKFAKFAKSAKSESAMTKNNLRQAYIPDGAEILYNDFGTAPGILIDTKYNGKRKIVVMLPGPPREVKPMFENKVVPYFKNITNNKINSRYLRIFGLGESAVENKIIDLVDNQTNPTIATYVKNSEVMIRVTSSGNSEEENMKLIDETVIKIKDIVGEYIYSENNEDLSDVVCRMLIEKNLSIATAESCTGGLIAKTLTDYPGISSVYERGYVTYSNEAKQTELGVSQEVLNKYGAVSEENALEMVKGLYKKTNCDICVAVTGIAGPDGGTEEKPVGLVYCAYMINGKAQVQKHQFTGERSRIRLRTSLTVFDNIRRSML